MSEHSRPKTVVVVGAGISGLCSAYFLQQQGFRVTVLESGDTVGGAMKTLHDDGWLIELGPNSALENTFLFGKLFDELALSGELVYTSEAAKKRYILRKGRLHPLPMSLGSLVGSKLLSVSGKVRLLKEPFVGRAAKEESLAEFVERRLGREFLDYFVNPFAVGVYAGNPEDLSLQSAFPKLYALEEAYGGLLRGMMKGRQKRNDPKERVKSFSFKRGMDVLPKELAIALGKNLLLKAAVEHIIPQRVGPRSIYTVTYRQTEHRRSVEADAVVLAVPASAAATIVHPIDPEMAKTLSSIYCVPVVQVFMGFQAAQIRHPLDGFGFLVPSRERRKILGTLWTSSMFPHRAPRGCAALATFVGGARHPELCDASDAELQSIVLSELRTILGIEGEPIFIKILRLPHAIPQYTLGYYKILQAMDRFEQNFRGTFLCSNYREGVSVGDCVTNAEKTAQKVRVHLS